MIFFSLLPFAIKSGTVGDAGARPSRTLLFK